MKKITYYALTAWLFVSSIVVAICAATLSFFSAALSGFFLDNAGNVVAGLATKLLNLAQKNFDVCEKYMSKRWPNKTVNKFEVKICELETGKEFWSVIVLAHCNLCAIDHAVGLMPDNIFETYKYIEWTVKLSEVS